MARRTRTELEAENLVLYRELEVIRDRLDQLFDGTRGSEEPSELTRAEAEENAENED